MQYTKKYSCTSNSPGDDQMLDFEHEDVTEESVPELWKIKAVFTNFLYPSKGRFTFYQAFQIILLTGDTASSYEVIAHLT